MRYTRTHTSFWDEEQIAAVSAQVEALAVDWTDRRDHVPPDLRLRGDLRLRLLRDAVTLAAEPAD